jgi:hypothetical protein
MALNWEGRFTAEPPLVVITPDRLVLFSEKVEALDTLVKIPATDRTPTLTAELRTATSDLKALMRDIKRRFIFSPPLTEAELISLGLQPKDSTPTTVTPPTGQAEGAITFPARTQHLLGIKRIAGTPVDPKSHYGFRVYFGAFAEGDQQPVSGMDLRESKFTRQKRMLFTYLPTDTGKTAYYCIRYENSKGDPGPWGPMCSALIP